MKKTYIAPFVETDMLESEDMMATSIVGIDGDSEVVLGDDDDVPTEADIREDLISFDW